MDETTYSDQGVIDLINRDYLPIRVDNDLRPDINSRYNMGGWPSTVFLTPRGDILTGATYLPPEQMQGALKRVGSFYRGNKPQVVAQVLENHAGLVTGLALAGEGEILDSATGYLERVLRDPESGLYAGSQDADEHYYALDEVGRRGLEPPYVDRRVYSNWNCMLAVAYLEADARLGRPGLRASALTLLERLFADRFSIDGGMAHTEDVRDQLADQAWALLAAVRAFQAGAGEGWLHVAA